MGRDLKPFWDGLAPDEALLAPLPVTVFPGIPRHTSLRELYRRLHSDGQDVSTARLVFFQQDEATKMLYLTDGHTRYQSTAALMQISSATTHEDADLPGLASVRDCYRLMLPAGPVLHRKPSALSFSSLTRAGPRTHHHTYAEVAIRPNPGLADTVTQISASRDPILLQRASQLIVEHMRTMEQTQTPGPPLPQPTDPSRPLVRAMGRTPVLLGVITLHPCGRHCRGGRPIARTRGRDGSVGWVRGGPGFPAGGEGRGRWQHREAKSEQGRLYIIPEGLGGCLLRLEAEANVECVLTVLLSACLEEVIICSWRTISSSAVVSVA